jgi:DNA-binding MarR family transcriptional regulator
VQAAQQNSLDSSPSSLNPDIEPETASMAALSEAVSSHAELVSDEPYVVPPLPETLADTGIPESIIEQLILKYLYFRGELVGREIAASLGLQFSLIDELLETLKRQQKVAVKKSLGMGNSSGLFALTEAGRAATREHLEYNQYMGPAPVPLYQYAEVVRRQRLAENWLNPDSLRAAFKHLVVEEDILAQIGPAVNSNKSFLIYGQPGNGKTALAESLFRVDSAPIYMPYAIECQGNLIQVYDPIYHQKIEEQEDILSAISRDHNYDRRWFKCRRPFIVTGGELTLDMLDLSYNKVSKIYDAPFQVKANNGIYLIDDFGRQKATPAEILNRWIVPMERRIDYLSFESGGKMTVPFEAFLIFSTNLRPDNLGDEAFLRRIQYKMFLRSPRAPEFLSIFQRFAESRELKFDPAVTQEFMRKHYLEGGKKFRRCHPRDVISHAIDIINFEGLPWELTGDVLDRAFYSCFVEHVDVDD